MVNTSFNNLALRQLCLVELLIKQFRVLEKKDKLLPGYKDELFKILDSLRIADYSVLKKQNNFLEEIEERISLKMLNNTYLK